MKVRNVISSLGNAVANQFIIETDEGRFFQSYDSMLSFVPNGNNEKVRLGKNWSYSPTTSKYRSKFLGETTKETQKKLDSGEYILDNEL